MNSWQTRLGLVLIIISILLSALVSPAFISLTLAYLFVVILGSLFIGKSWLERLILPVVILTMHLVWGAGFLLSPKGLIAEEE